MPITPITTLLRRSALLLIAFSLFWLTLWASTRIAPPDNALQIKQLLRSDAAIMAQPALPTRLIDLPDDWFASGEDIGSAWYSTQFELPRTPDHESAQLWGVYLPSVMMNAAVYLNRELIGLDGRLSIPVTRNWNHPLLFQIPVGLLRSGANTLQIHLHADLPGTGFLGQIYLGPLRALTPSYEQAYLIRVTVVQMSVIGTLTMAFFMFVLWFMRHQDGVYLWFGIGLVCWTVHNLNIIVTDPPVAPDIWVRLMAAMIIWVTICTAFYALRFLNQHRPRRERLLIMVGILSGITIPFMPAEFFHPQQLPFFEIIAMAIGLYATSIMLSAFLSHRPLKLETAIVTILAVCMMSTGGYDFLIITNIIERNTPYMLPYSAPFVIVGFGFVLVHRFAAALQFAEKLNITLEQRVAEKSLELERKHQQLRHYERQQAIATERQRIVRDMHDGLVSTLSAIESGRAELSGVSQALRAAIDDLRLSIDSLDPEANGLGPLLGLLRARLEPHLQSCGVQLDWRVRPLPEHISFGPQKSLQILRIVQEAVTNALKHAGASKVTVRTRLEQRSACLEVIDDGQGIQGVHHNGRGLRNMQTRAGKIGARLDIHSGQTGTRIQLLFDESLTRNGKTSPNPEPRPQQTRLFASR